MANLNKVMLIGRLTRDVEVRAFSNGGKVAKFGFAVNNRRKNSQTGQWEDEPVFLDVEVFNRGENGRMADLAEQYLAKGRQVYIEGHLRLVDCEDADVAEITVSRPLLDRYQRTLAAFIERARDFCTKRGMVYLLVNNQLPVQQLVSSYLRQRGLVR